MINTLPKSKILDKTKLKAFTDDKINVAKMMISLSDRAENIMGKGKNVCYQHFPFSHNVLKSSLFQGH